MFDRAAVVGVGLLGASLGMVLRKTGLCRHVTGVGRNPETLVRARDLGAVDDFDTRLEAVLPVELVILATPAAAVADYLRALSQHTSENRTMAITDVASTKAAICAEAARLWPISRPFVGAHPMTGGEKWGPDSANPDLYRNAVCFVEASADDIDPAVHERVRTLWEVVGCQVVEIDPLVHDRMLSRTSHLPHVVAAVLALVAQKVGADSCYIGNGFRDATRIAAGRAEIWRDICLTNQEEILSALQEFHDILKQFYETLRSGDGAYLEKLFDEARAARCKITGS